MRRISASLVSACTLAAPMMLLQGCNGASERFYDRFEFVELTEWGEGFEPGAIVTFEDGRAVQVAEAGMCAPFTLPLEEQPREQRLGSEFPRHNSWDANVERPFEQNLGRLIEPRLTVMDAVGLREVAYVRFELIDGTVLGFSPLDLERRIELALSTGDESAWPCMDLLEKPRHYLVMDRFGFEGLRVQFLSPKRNPVPITDRILDKINASPELASKYRGALGIEIMRPTNVAFTLGELNTLDAFAGDSPVRMHVVEREEVHRVRWGTTRR